MRINLPILYSQQDPQWGKTLLGTNTDPQFDFYNYGCLLASLAMVCVYYQKQENLLSLNEKLVSITGFVNGGEYVYGAVPTLYPDITEKETTTPNALTDEQIAEIKAALDNKQPVIIGLDYNPKTVAVDYHFVVVVDYNPGNENDFTVADPLGGKVHSLRDYLGWFKPSARNTIERYIIYSGPLPAEIPDITDTPAQPAPAFDVPATPVETPAENPPVLPSNYDDIVHGSTQWDQTVAYLELEKTPAEASFENVKRVIAGIKSRQVDLDNQRVEANKQAAELAVTVANQKEDISRIEGEALRQQKLSKAEIDSLKANTPTFDTLKRQYEGVVTDLKSSLESKVEEVKTLRINLAKMEVEIEAKDEAAFEATPTGTTGKLNLVDALIAGIKRLLFIKL